MFWKGEHMVQMYDLYADNYNMRSESEKNLKYQYLGLVLERQEWVSRPASDKEADHKLWQM